MIGELAGTTRILKLRDGHTGNVTKKRARDLLAACETVHRFRV